jgi:hypothetical protein
MNEPSTDRRTGIAAVTAAVLLFASVAAEMFWTVQSPDGTVTNTAGFVLYLLAWIAGTVALVVALLGLRAHAVNRAGVAGAWITTTGAVLLAGFGVLVVVGALVTGAPIEASFLVFAVGLLLLGVGSVPLALGLRRSGLLGGWWLAVLVAGAGALVAVVASADPWHDLGLFTFDAAWFALGLRLLTPQRRSVPA